MSIKYVLLATEGPHDQAAVGKILKLGGLKKFDGDRQHLDSFWVGFIPTYPKKENLYARMDMPSIFSSSIHSVAVYQGNGSNLINNLRATIAAFPQYAQNIHAFGLIVDADAKKPGSITEHYAQNLRDTFPSLPRMPGVIAQGQPKTGIYVFPNNLQEGTLDTVLVQCASIAYPEHKIGAETFINSLSDSHRQHWRGFDHQKAVVASITSVLKPGMANTPSIDQDGWLCEQTIQQVAEVAALKRFIDELLAD